MSAREGRLSALCLAGRAKGAPAVRVEELACLANRAESDSAYAHDIALALRMTIKSVTAESEPCPRNEYLGDAEIRRRMDLALTQLSPKEIHGLASSLLAGPKATKENLHYLKDLVERQVRNRAERAMLGRRFTILCEAVAARVPLHFGAHALEGLNVWDWHPNLSPHAAEVARPWRLPRICSTLYQGVRHLVMTAFAPEEATKERVRHARVDLCQAARAFMQTYAQEMGQWSLKGRSGGRFRERGDHGLSDAAAHLEVAKLRYEAECAALGVGECDAMRMSTHRVRVYEMAFLDALSGMPGRGVDTLGRYCAGLACEETPSASRFPLLVHCMRNALWEERAIRTGAEVVHALMQYIATWESASFARMLAQCDMPQRIAGINVGNRQDGPPSASHSREMMHARNVLLDHIQTLNQRFRLRERPFGHVHVWTVTDLIRAGVERLPAITQHRLRDAICDSEWKLPESLAADEPDELMLGLIRAFQPSDGAFSTARLSQLRGPAQLHS